LSDDGVADLLATKIKRQCLHDSYPSINATLLDEMFRDNGWVLLLLLLLLPVLL